MLFSIFGLFACSSVGELKVERDFDTRIDHGSAASLSVQLDEQVEKTEAVQEAVRRLRYQLFGRLVGEGVFSEIVPSGETAKYDVQVRLLAVTEVSQTSRILFGVLAGANELAVRVNVIDTADQNSLVSFMAKGKSASHPLSSENDMDDAIREAVDKVIYELTR
jgi:hypothetical protein